LLGLVVLVFFGVYNDVVVLYFTAQYQSQAIGWKDPPDRPLVNRWDYRHKRPGRRGLFWILLYLIMFRLLIVNC